MSRHQPPSSRKPTANRSPGLHPRNPHRGRYDFAQLTRTLPALSAFLKKNPRGEQTIDFADAQAVKTLNQALLAQFYQIEQWDIPAGYLCPPIPGRADYLHHLADLLAEDNSGRIPQGGKVQALDIGTGANLIYPIIGSQSYGWQFIGADIDPVSVECARLLVEANPVLNKRVSIRLQKKPEQIFTGLVKPGEQFDVSLCNPPFHASPQAARAGTERKHRNLAANQQRRGQQPGQKRDNLNFGGQKAELWCPGGEAAFVGRMITQSQPIASQLCWFTSLISSQKNLAPLQKQLKQQGATSVEVIPMSQGQKQSRILAWSFMNAGQRREWAKFRWQ